VLAFYPSDWSPVCSDQMGLYAQIMPEFKKFDEVLGISVDGIWSHLAFAKVRKLNFPLLSDFEPKGAVSKAYGAYEAAIRLQELSDHERAPVRRMGCGDR
jgi:peroxiredoxin